MPVGWNVGYIFMKIITFSYLQKRNFQNMPIHASKDTKNKI